MSKIKPNKITFDNKDFLVEINDGNESTPDSFSNDSANIEETVEVNDREVNKAKELAETIINKANKEKDKIIEQAKKESEEIKNKANEEAGKILENANKQSLELLENSKTELEKQITSSANEGYTAGYNDGLEKIKEELTSRVGDFGKFCNLQAEIKNKILKSASKDILNIIIGISKKILPKEVDANSIEKIINNTVSLLEKKEDITIILSEKYAKILYDLQNNSLADEAELKFENFKQYNGFNVIYNPKFSDDTIIVETPLERFDASINSQLDVIIRDIFENTQNGKIDNIEQYENEA